MAQLQDIVVPNTRYHYKSMICKEGCQLSDGVVQRIMSR
jgi:hypothetical protein